jgi:hypothetical protein
MAAGGRGISISPRRKAIEPEGAVSDDLMSVLLAISEMGWPLAVKRAAKTWEIRIGPR